MTGRVEYLKDVLGNNYLGISVYPTEINPFLDKLKNILGDEYQTYVNLQQTRDRGKHHITVINVEEYNRLSGQMGMDKFINSLELIFNYEVDDMKLMGVGKAERAGNVAYFVPVKSEKLAAIRKRFELDEKDFHITLGFKWKDVHGVPKRDVIKETDDFIKKLSDLYFRNNESFDFLKELDNFEGDEDSEIEPIKIEKTYATFRNGLNNYFTVSLIENSMRISCQWQDSESKPILSRTLVARKLK